MGGVVSHFGKRNRIGDPEAPMKRRSHPLCRILAPVEGLGHSVGGISRIANRLPNAELWIVGHTDLREQVAADLYAEMRDLNKRTRSYLSGMSFGPDLFQHFADADSWFCQQGVEARRAS